MTCGHQTADNKLNKQHSFIFDGTLKIREENGWLNSVSVTTFSLKVHHYINTSKLENSLPVEIYLTLYIQLV